MEISSRGTRSWRSFGRVWSRAPMSRWRYRFSAEPSTTAGPREASSKRSPGAATALLTTRSRARAIRLSPRTHLFGLQDLWLAGCHSLLGHIDQAIGFFRKAHAAHPRRGPDLWLAAALGLNGDLGEAKATLSEWLKFHPKLGSLARVRASLPFPGNPQFLGAARENGGSGSAQCRHAGGMNALARPE